MNRMAIGTPFIVLGLIGLVAASMRSNTLQSVPVEKLRSADGGAHPYVGQRLRVVGFVAAAPVTKTPESSAGGVVDVNHFKVEDKGAFVAVQYRDALPDTFRKGGPVEVDGVYQAPGLMLADHVLTKCPSKYQAGEKPAGATMPARMAQKY